VVRAADLAAALAGHAGRLRSGRARRRGVEELGDAVGDQRVSGELADPGPPGLGVGEHDRVQRVDGGRRAAHIGQCRACPVGGELGLDGVQVGLEVDVAGPPVHPDRGLPGLVGARDSRKRVVAVRRRSGRRAGPADRGRLRRQRRRQRDACGVRRGAGERAGDGVVGARGRVGDALALRTADRAVVGAAERHRAARQGQDRVGCGRGLGDLHRQLVGAVEAGGHRQGEGVVVVQAVGGALGAVAVGVRAGDGARPTRAHHPRARRRGQHPGARRRARQGRHQPDRGHRDGGQHQQGTAQTHEQPISQQQARTARTSPTSPTPQARGRRPR